MKTISFVIPVYNEEKRLEKTFKALKELQLPRELKLKEVIFVSDGSTDKTVSGIKYYVLSIKKKYKIHLIGYKENMGKGHAVRLGMTHSTSDYTLFFDADMSTPLSELNKFVPFMKSSIDVIIGTRKNGESTVLEHQPFLRELLGHGFTKVTQLLLGLNISDFTCGFKAFSKSAKDEILEKSKVNRWAYDAEFLFILKRANYSMVEIPVIWSNHKSSKVKLYKDIPQTFYELIKLAWKMRIVLLLNCSIVKLLRIRINSNEAI